MQERWNRDENRRGLPNVSLETENVKKYIYKVERNGILVGI